MAGPKTDSTVLTIWVPTTLDRRLAREARRRRLSRSEVARNILQAGLAPDEPDLAAEARRQSLLVSGRRSEREAIAFVVRAADTRRWR